MGIVRATLFIVGTCIGAGFLSGAELVRFFRVKDFLPPVLLSSFVFFIFCIFFLFLGKKYGGYRKAVHMIFKRFSPVIYTALPALSVIPCAGMLAGLDSLIPALSPFVSIAGLALVLCFIKKGLNGISLLNLLLVPLLLIFVFFNAKNLSFSYASLPERGGFLGGVVYAGMNGLLAAPVLMDAGDEMKHIMIPAFFSAVVVAASATCVLGSIYREGANALNAEMPFLYVMRGEKIFYVAAVLAILTSLASSLYPLMELSNRLEGKKQIAAKSVTLLAVCLLSRLGLSDIITFFYPFSGIFGLSFLIFCIFDEYFFQKHNKKIHGGSQQAEDTS